MQSVMEVLRGAGISFTALKRLAAEPCGRQRTYADDPRLDPNIDPKRARRILANRESAARSRLRRKLSQTEEGQLQLGGAGEAQQQQQQQRLGGGAPTVGVPAGMFAVSGGRRAAPLVAADARIVDLLTHKVSQLEQRIAVLEAWCAPQLPPASCSSLQHPTMAPMPHAHVGVGVHHHSGHFVHHQQVHQQASMQFANVSQLGHPMSGVCSMGVTSMGHHVSMGGMGSQCGPPLDGDWAHELAMQGMHGLPVGLMQGGSMQMQGQPQGIYHDVSPYHIGGLSEAPHSQTAPHFQPAPHHSAHDHVPGMRLDLRATAPAARATLPLPLSAAAGLGGHGASAAAAAALRGDGARVGHTVSVGAGGSGSHDVDPQGVEPRFFISGPGLAPKLELDFQMHAPALWPIGSGGGGAPATVGVSGAPSSCAPLAGSAYWKQ